MQNRDSDIKTSELDKERSLLGLIPINSEPEEAFDDLSRLAAYVCKTPIALITFLEKDKEWVKSIVGVKTEKKVFQLECSFGVLLKESSEDYLAVFNPKSHESIAKNPLISTIKDIDFYAGVPLHDANNYMIGTLSVLGYKPKDLSFEQLTLLQTIAKQIILQLELKKEPELKSAPVLDFVKQESAQKLDKVQDNKVNKLCYPESDLSRVDALTAAKQNAFERSESEATTERDKDLSDWVGKLETQSRQLILLCEMNELLQAANCDKDIYTIIKNYVRTLFPNTSGALYVLNDALSLIQDVATWGDSVRSEHSFSPDMCWALRLGRIHSCNSSTKELYCQHVTAGDQLNSLCSPLSAGSKTLGLLYIEERAESPGALSSEGIINSNTEYVLSTIAKHSGLALANVKQRQKLGTQAVYDSLTGLFNRRYMEETLKRELSRVTRKKNPLGLIMADIDHFKNFNDSYGHAAGDALLRSLGTFLKEHIRREDIACRYGGEEFVLIMPESSLENTKRRAEQIREEIKQLRVWHHGNLIDSVNISMGVVVFSEHGSSAETLLESADKALYKAKREGRDRIEVAT